MTALNELPLEQRLAAEGETPEYQPPRPKPEQGKRLKEEAEREAEAAIFEEEEEKAILYRDNWDAKIIYRQNQLYAYQGSYAAYQALWEEWYGMYEPTNYINETPGNEGGWISPMEYDQNGAISSSTVRLPFTRHASDQNDHPYEKPPRIVDLDD